MKKFFLFAFFLGSFIYGFAQQPDAIKGIWMNDEKDAKIEIYKSGASYFGKIIWTKDMYQADGKTPKKDTRNPDAALQNRTIQHLVILSGFTYDDGEWNGGEIYDPKSGKTYKSKMKLKGANLEIRGYLGSSFFGKTTVWTRA